MALSILAVITAVISLPFQFRAKAASGSSIQSRDEGMPNYDIRSDKTAIFKLATYRDSVSKSAVEVADLREEFVTGEARLRSHIPTLKIEYNTDIRTPEVIATDVRQGKAFLSNATAQNRSDALKSFLRNNVEIVGTRSSQIDELKVAADYTNPDGNLSFVELNQEIDGIPVFRGEVKAGFTKAGQIIRVINNLAPGLDGAAISTEFGEAIVAAKMAAASINITSEKLDLRINEKTSTDLKTVFGNDDSSTTAEKMYFPTEPGVVVPAWRVLIWRPINAYYVIIDAKNGTLLWRKNITDDQTQSATYSVYTNPNAMVNVAHSPFPFSPAPTMPAGQQGNPLARSLVTRVGNEAPYTFNNQGWIPDGVTVTDGNAIQAGLDRDGTDGVDPNSEATSPIRNFSFEYSPLDPNDDTGDAPIPATQTYPGSAYQQGIVTQLFYIANWFHDETYRLGFTEAARNFQHTNFTGQGVGGDRVRGEGQDSSGVNNANFSTGADGTRGRMQMYIFSGPNPDIDGSLDADVVIHEHTHGLSNRLHGNSAGLFNDMSRGMGEGWSDFYGMAMLSQASDPIDSLATNGAYATYRFSGSTNNAYYGIRRFPTAIKTSVGGPGNQPHNPLTFADIDATQLNISDGAFSASGGGNADEVHNAGEIWCVALWEVRARMIQRLGWEVGNRRILQLVTDGMKLAPLSPTPISERDAIIAAAFAWGSAADVADIWAGFRIRGLGASASIQDVGGTSIGGTGRARVTEAFDPPNLYQIPAITVSDAVGDNDGYPEPGETVTISVPLTNSTGTTATGVTLQIVGGGTASYGSLGGTSSGTESATYSIPAGTACGSLITVTLNVDSSLGPVSFERQIFVGKPGTTTATEETFDGVTAPAIPAGWSAVANAGGINFVSSTTAPNSSPNAMFALDPLTIGGGTDLTAPPISVSSLDATITFSNNYNTEAGWDGGVLEISVAGGDWQDILSAGGTFIQNGYNGVLGAGTNNPIANRAAWTGDSGGYVTTIAQLPPAANGKVVQFRFRFGADNNTAAVGWYIDNVSLTGAGIISGFSCSNGGSASPADFDGDGRTDLSIFRPSDGNWWLNRSTDGLTVVNFGLSGDIPTPADFDGDGKADIAVWRPSSGVWYRINSGNGTFSAEAFGQTDDIPQAADFDGDGKSDISIFRPSTGTWWQHNSGDGEYRAIGYGLDGDRPVTGDYDGDGKSDIAVFRPSNGTWYRINSGSGQDSILTWGLAQDMPANADYDGDNKDDIAVFRPSDGIWYVLGSSANQVIYSQWGLSGDIPIPGDYDGDGRDDVAVYRAGVWYIKYSTGSFAATHFGLASDVPIPQKHLP
ncbi:MAG: M36 family metallopeptidase [Pyrinomonadaceae bacterium]